MLSSQYLSILNNLQTQVQTLNLTFNGQAVTVAVKKIAQWLEGVSLPPLPIILIAPDDKPEDVKPWSTEDEVLVKYHCAVIAIAAGNRDNTVNLDVWLNWREQERRLFQWGMQAQIQSCFFAEVNPDPPILKDAALKNYDVSGLGFTFWNVEPKGN